jgi:hypothetical protein
LKAYATSRRTTVLLSSMLMQHSERRGHGDGHDHAHERAADVVTAGPEPVDHHSPGQRPGEEDVTGGRDDAAEAGEPTRWVIV